MVRLEGLEPPRRKAQVPKTCVSTNFTTGAFYIDLDPTGLHIYSTVSQDPSTGTSMYSTSIVSHCVLVSNHCTSCSKQVDPEQTVNSICQMISILVPLYGAGTKIRTRDLLITNQLLYQLSYAGNIVLSRDSRRLHLKRQYRVFLFDNQK